MSKLDDLLQGVNVEWVDLGNIAKIFSGGTPNTSKAEFYDGDIPWIRSGEVNFNVITTSARNITKQGLSGSSAKLIRKNSVVLAMTGATVGRSAVIQFETSSNQSVAAIETNENIIFYKYLYYILENNYQDMKNAGQGALTSLNLSMIKKFKIQIPCPDNPEKSLKIQQEIVRILDQLTDTTNNLKNELENERQIRKKQFEFYREQLLSFEKNDIEWKEIKDIFNLKNGYTPSKSKQEYWEDGTIPWFRMEDIRKNGRVLKEAIQKINISAIKGGKLFPANSLIVATSATIGEHALVKVPYLSNQRFTNLSLKEEYTLKYNVEFLNYYCFILDEWCKNNTTIGNFAGVDMTKFKKFMFPIPSLEEQERIVKLLDQFDAAHTAIEEEITKEIKLRTQQYEYYREKLLTFPKN